jgi:hypothetical protein
MRSFLNRTQCDSTLLICNDLSIDGRERGNVDKSVICATIPLLTTLFCPQCKGTTWHLLLRDLPHELICDRCGCILHCRAES